MKLFSKRKEEYMIWQGIYNNQKRLIRVDKTFENKHYKHTYCIELTYSDGIEDVGPSKEFMEKSGEVEEKIIEAINKHHNNKIMFVGSDMFGGKRLLVFVSNKQLDWLQFVEQIVPNENINAFMLKNDNMSYYNECLFPNFIKGKL